jgi:peptidyl-prolyl cis-trans isomerase C
MSFIQKIVKLATVPAVVLWAGTAAFAQSEDKVVAVVNGHEIRTSEVQMASDDIMGQLPDLPPKARYPFVVNYLIERHLLAQHAVKEGIADTDDYKKRLALYQAKALRDAYFFEKVRPQVTEEEIKAVYDKEAANIQQTERVRARHILVDTEQEAKDIEAKLVAGEKFEDLAKKFSKDGSKEYGGDLGYFTAAEMVPDFSKAAFALQKGDVSQPVKTDYGWHIIKLEDRKLGGAQPLDQVKPAIRNILLRQKVQNVVLDLRKSAKIEITDPDLKKYIEEQEKRAKQALEARQKKLQQGGQPAPDAGAGDAMGDGAATTDGKSDPLLPQP